MRRRGPPASLPWPRDTSCRHRPPAAIERSRPLSTVGSTTSSGLLTITTRVCRRCSTLGSARRAPSSPLARGERDPDAWARSGRIVGGARMSVLRGSGAVPPGRRAAVGHGWSRRSRPGGRQVTAPRRAQDRRPPPGRAPPPRCRRPRASSPAATGRRDRERRRRCGDGSRRRSGSLGVSSRCCAW